MTTGEEPKWWLGPPAPLAVTRMMRALQLAIVVVMATWLFGTLGGVKLSPRPVPGGNDTGQLFNWHPLLITLAFPVLMAEAVLAYKAPLLNLQGDRPRSKAYHLMLHTAALLLTILGVVAAFKSHTLKRPATPNLYSVHSWLGMSVLTLLTLQYCLGAAAYVFPKLSAAQRRALGPLHTFLGRSIFAAGLATMAVGIQEKATFVQAFAKPALRSGVMTLPAALVVLVLLLGIAVLYHHATPAAPAPQQQWEREEVVSLVEAVEPSTSFDGEAHTA
ncbi:putative transmembrane ascorbate ferrireductase 2 [Chlorella vulgaris]